MFNTELDKVREREHPGCDYELRGAEVVTQEVPWITVFTMFTLACNWSVPGVDKQPIFSSCIISV
jgi:hypothetical protein